MIHFQPLPLFIPEDLSDFMACSPRLLLYSFLALALSVKPHAVCQGKELHTAEYYACLAEDAVWKLASQGVSKLEVIQSLCLLALRDIFGKHEICPIYYFNYNGTNLI